MRYFFVICALFGLYSQIPISVGWVEIPNVLGLSAGAVLIAVNLNKMQISHLKAMLAVLGVALLSILMAPQFGTFLPGRILALTQLLISMLAGYGLHLELIKRSAHHTARLLLWLCAIILIGSALEVFTPLRGPIISFNAIFFDYDFEEQVLRDLVIAGFARPIFLTSEPSHVAIGIIVFAISALILKPTWRMALWTSGLLILGLIIVRSPSIVIGFPMIFIVFWFAQRKHLQRFERSKRSVRAFGLLVVIGAPILGSALFLLADRIAQISSGNDYSASIRLFASIEVGLNTAISYPISGVGLGGFEASRELIIETLIENRVPVFIAEEFWDTKLNNGIGTHLMYFGFFLLSLYLLAFYRLLARLSGGNGTMIILLMICLSFLTGGIYAPKFVIYYFLFAAVAHIAFHANIAGQGHGQNTAYAGGKTPSNDIGGIPDCRRSAEETLL